MHTHKTFCIALAVYPRTAIIVSLLLLGRDKNKSQIDCLTFNDGGVYCPFDDQFSWIFFVVCPRMYSYSNTHSHTHTHLHSLLNRTYTIHTQHNRQLGTICLQLLLEFLPTVNHTTGDIFGIHNYYINTLLRWKSISGGCANTLELITHSYTPIPYHTFKKLLKIHIIVNYNNPKFLCV